MKRILDYLWPLVGLAAVVASFYLLAREFNDPHQSVSHEVWTALKAIAPHRYLLAALSTIVAYGALAWYDRLALFHLGVRHISMAFVSLCSFTTYALSHNIGASVFSGAMVRFRAYTSKGLSGAQVAVLVAFCSFTFALGVILLGGLVLVFEPEQLKRLDGLLPKMLTQVSTARMIGLALLAFVALYLIGSVLRFKPLQIGKFKLEYPAPGITLRQIVIAPMELIGAAGIIYFALPEQNNPGLFVVLAVFLASFSAALVSNAPGGLGVFEFVFIKAMPNIPKTEVLAALLVFRLFYLILPLIFAIIVVLVFERGRLVETLSNARAQKDFDDVK
jgi:hypothetical protein